MMYIKLDEQMNLTITAPAPIYRGDNLSQKITYLLPMNSGEIDIGAASVYLSYIRADGTTDVVCLDKKQEMYKGNYYQFALPITCKMSRVPGEVCTWLQILAGNAALPQIGKSGICSLYVEDSPNLDDYLSDSQISAIYELQKQMNASEETIEELGLQIAKKGDNLSYNGAEQTLQLLSEGALIGDAVDMSNMVNHDETIHFGEESDEPKVDEEAVIYFG